MSKMRKLQPECKHILSQKAASLMGSKHCGALYKHHHCLACEWPIPDNNFPDNKYCGSCAWDFGEDWPSEVRRLSDVKLD